MYSCCTVHMVHSISKFLFLLHLALRLFITTNWIPLTSPIQSKHLRVRSFYLIQLSHSQACDLLVYTQVGLQPLPILVIDVKWTVARSRLRPSLSRDGDYCAEQKGYSEQLSIPLSASKHSPNKVLGLRLTCLNGANEAYNKTSCVVQRQVEVDDVTCWNTIWC